MSWLKIIWLPFWFQIDPNSRPEFELVHDELTELLSSNDIQPDTIHNEISETINNMHINNHTSHDDQGNDSSQLTNSSQDDCQINTSNITKQKPLQVSKSLVSSTNPELASKPSDIEPNKSAQSVTNGNLNPHSSKELFDNCITTPKIDPTNGQLSQTPKFRGMFKNYTLGIS